MMIRSFLFTAVACCVTYFLSIQSQPVFFKVDLQKFLKDKAVRLSKQDFKKDMLDLEILKIQKDLNHLLKDIATKNKAIILTGPTYGDVTDITEDVLKAIEKEE